MKVVTLLAMLVLLVLLVVAATAWADDSFQSRQIACNGARARLSIYVTRASGFTFNQNSQYGHGGRLTDAEVSDLNHQYWLATADLLWEIRDAAFEGDTTRCQRLLRSGVAAVNEILVRQFGKVDASISSPR